MILFMILVGLSEMLFVKRVADQNRQLAIENASMRLTLQGKNYFYVDQKTFERCIKGKYKVVVVR